MSANPHETVNDMIAKMAKANGHNPEEAIKTVTDLAKQMAPFLKQAPTGLELAAAFKALEVSGFGRVTIGKTNSRVNTGMKSSMPDLSASAADAFLQENPLEAKLDVARTPWQRAKDWFRSSAE